MKSKEPVEYSYKCKGDSVSISLSNLHLVIPNRQKNAYSALQSEDPRESTASWAMIRLSFNKHLLNRFLPQIDS